MQTLGLYENGVCGSGVGWGGRGGGGEVTAKTKNGLF